MVKYLSESVEKALLVQKTGAAKPSISSARIHHVWSCVYKHFRTLDNWAQEVQTRNVLLIAAHLSSVAGKF